MSDATPTPFSRARESPSISPTSRPSSPSSGGRRPSKSAGRSSKTRNVTRIVLANLVVESLDGERRVLEPVLETVIAQFPCRAIVVRGSDEPERRIKAEVSALCHLPAPGLPQVCSERIVLRAGPDAMTWFPAPSVRCSRPTCRWCSGGPSDPGSTSRCSATWPTSARGWSSTCPTPVLTAGALRLGLDPSLCPCSRDSAWFGLARWRELVAQFFDSSVPLSESLRRIDSVIVEAHFADPARPPRLAIWLAAWLAGQLGWKPQGQPVTHPVVDSAA